jgi:hypothetical protein
MKFYRLISTRGYGDVVKPISLRDVRILFPLVILRDPYEYRRFLINKEKVWLSEQL